MNSSSETTTSPFFDFTVTGDDLFLEPPGLLGRAGLQLRIEGKLVLLVAGDLELGRHVLRGDAHMVALEGVPKPVPQHGVDELHRAHLYAVAQMGRMRGGAHALHAAGRDDIAFAGADLLSRQRHRAQAGAAELVDAEGGLVVRHAGGAGGLTRRVLTLAGGQDLAEDQLVHLRGRNAGAFERALDRNGGQLVGGECAQRAIEVADRRAGRGYDNDVFHDLFLTPLGCAFTPCRAGRRQRKLCSPVIPNAAPPTGKATTRPTSAVSIKRRAGTLFLRHLHEFDSMADAARRASFQGARRRGDGATFGRAAAVDRRLVGDANQTPPPASQHLRDGGARVPPWRRVERSNGHGEGPQR